MVVRRGPPRVSVRAIDLDNEDDATFVLYCLDCVGVPRDIFESGITVSNLVFLGRKRAGLYIISRECFWGFVHYEFQLSMCVKRFRKYNPLAPAIEHLMKHLRGNAEVTSTPHRMSIVLDKTDTSNMDFFHSLGFRPQSENNDSVRYIWPNDEVQ